MVIILKWALLINLLLFHHIRGSKQSRKSAIFIKNLEIG